jgi:hypothetical protein
MQKHSQVSAAMSNGGAAAQEPSVSHSNTYVSPFLMLTKLRAGAAGEWQEWAELGIFDDPFKILLR